MTQGRENKVEKFHLVGRIRGPRARGHERRFIGGGRAKNSRISSFSCARPSRETNEPTILVEKVKRIRFRSKSRFFTVEK